jgi:hypothetical protein
MLLIATDMSVEDLENIVTLDYNQHKHLHTNSYQAKIFIALRNASNEVARNNNIEEFSKKFTISIENLIDNILNAKAKEFGVALKSFNVDGTFKTYTKKFNTAEIKDELKKEVAKVLTNIRKTLLIPTY